MKIEKTFLEDHQVQLNVVIDDETFEASKRRAAKKISRDQRIPGFRPGNAPYAIIVRHVGENTVIEQALELLVDDIYPKLLDSEDITPYGPGQLKNVKQLVPPELEFVVPLAPSVELSDYTAIRLEYALPEITEADVDRTIQNLRDRQAKTEPVERPAQVGDLLSITLHGRDLNGAEDAGLLVDVHDAPVVIEPDDADQAEEWPFPGFSNALKGLEKGGTAKFQHTYADDYAQDESLTGKSVEFEVTVHEVSSRMLPELDDDFAKTVGGYEDLANLRTEARTHLEDSARNSYESDFENRLLDQVVAESVFHFPPQMVEDEIDTLVDNFKNRLSNEGWDLDTYLKANQKDMDVLRAEFRPTAERRIRRGLALMEIADREQIRVAERDVQQEVQRTVDLVNATFPEKERRKILTDEFLHGLVSSAMRDALTERTFARLKAIARGETDEPSEEDSAAPDETPTETADENPAETPE